MGLSATCGDLLGDDFAVEGVWCIVVAGGGSVVFTDGEFVLRLDGNEAGGSGGDLFPVDGERKLFVGNFGEAGDFTVDLEGRGWGCDIREWKTPHDIIKTPYGVDQIIPEVPRLRWIGWTP